MKDSHVSIPERVLEALKQSTKRRTVQFLCVSIPERVLEALKRRARMGGCRTR